MLLIFFPQILINFRLAEYQPHAECIGQGTGCGQTTVLSPPPSIALPSEYLSNTEISFQFLWHVIVCDATILCPLCWFPCCYYSIRTQKVIQRQSQLYPPLFVMPSTFWQIPNSLGWNTLCSQIFCLSVQDPKDSQFSPKVVQSCASGALQMPSPLVGMLFVSP